MTPTRAALALPAMALVLSACGAASTITAHTVSDPHPPAAVNVAPAPGRSLHSPAVHIVPPVVHPAGPTSQPIPTTPASGAYMVATDSISGSVERLEILSASGTVVAATQINPSLAWMIGSGAGGAYWSQSGELHELTPSGVVRTLGSMPADAAGMLISPDGNSYAYSTSDQTDTVNVNRIVVVAPGAAPKVIADRVSNSLHPTADAPTSWDYYLVNWNAAGIAFARVPTGGCGCGSFDMQMQSAYSGLINPVTEAVTTLTASNSCPLSTVGSGFETVCFDGTSTTKAIHIASGPTLIHNFTLSGSTVAGDAVFSPDGGSLAYVTIPVAQDSCDDAVTPTLRILNFATGKAISLAFHENFGPTTWTADGLLYGSISTPSGWATIAVNTATLAVTRLTPATQSAHFVGII